MRWGSVRGTSLWMLGALDAGSQARTFLWRGKATHPSSATPLKQSVMQPDPHVSDHGLYSGSLRHIGRLQHAPTKRLGRCARHAARRHSHGRLTSGRSNTGGGRRAWLPAAALVAAIAAAAAAAAAAAPLAAQLCSFWAFVKEGQGRGVVVGAVLLRSVGRPGRQYRRRRSGAAEAPRAAAAASAASAAAAWGPCSRQARERASRGGRSA